MINSIKIGNWISALALVICMTAVGLVPADPEKEKNLQVFDLDHEPKVLLAGA